MANQIKFCRTNYCNGTAPIKEQAESNLNYQVQEEDCLGNCGQCYLESFVVVDGEFVAVSTYEELVEKLNERVALGR